MKVKFHTAFAPPHASTLTARRLYAHGRVSERLRHTSPARSRRPIGLLSSPSHRRYDFLRIIIIMIINDTILSTQVIRARRRRLRDKAAPHSADFSPPVHAFLLNSFLTFDFRWSRRDIFDEHNTYTHAHIVRRPHLVLLSVLSGQFPH